MHLGSGVGVWCISIWVSSIGSIWVVVSSIASISSVVWVSSITVVKSTIVSGVEWSRDDSWGNWGDSRWHWESLNWLGGKCSVLTSLSSGESSSKVSLGSSDSLIVSQVGASNWDTWGSGKSSCEAGLGSCDSFIISQVSASNWSRGKCSMLSSLGSLESCIEGGLGSLDLRGVLKSHG